MNGDPNKAYRVDQAAVALGVCERTVHTLVKRRALGWEKIGRRLVIRQKHLDAYRASHEVLPRLQAPAVGGEQREVLRRVLEPIVREIMAEVRREAA